jgi:hypothetical protein
MCQTQCTLCNRSLRIEIISPFPNFKYKISERNPSTRYGGMFCSAYCGAKYAKITEDTIKNYKKQGTRIKVIQRWWRRLAS